MRSAWVEPGEVLLHIGPHKTGTTALQNAFAHARPRLAELGVRYPGDRASHWHAAAAVLQRTTGGGSVPDRDVWNEVVTESLGHDGRTFVSSEFFCEADDEGAARVVAELQRPVRVVLTLRSLERLLPSTWQQAVKTTAMPTYERWLHRVLDRPRRAVVWRRFDTVALVDRWAGIVGRDRVCAVLLDERDPGAVLGEFAQLLGIPAGVLTLPAVSNRSMTAAEAAAVRHIYERLGDALPDRLRQHWLRRGAIAAMVEGYRPAKEEPRIVTPAWAIDRARGLQAELNAGLLGTGVRIVGDLDTLIGSEPAPPDGTAWPEALPVAAVAELVVGSLQAAEKDLVRAEKRLARVKERLARARRRRREVRSVDLARAGTGPLLKEVARRADPRRRRASKGSGGPSR